ncbi:hypothetical protein BN1263110056 [Stenotrophomonas indicatrix]|nr:hypothetical protein BN1263110056 [Stenotrophomonas indicatrix]
MTCSASAATARCAGADRAGGCRPWSARSLPDGDGFAALDAFHRALEGQRRALCGHRFEAGEVGAVGFHRFHQHVRADHVDAQPARQQFQRRRPHETFQRMVDGGGVGAIADRLRADDAAGQGDRAASVEMVLRGQCKAYLAEQLVLQADVELFGCHLLQRAEMQLAGGGDHRIDRAGLREQLAHAGVVGEVHAQAAAVAAGSEDVVLLAQVAGDRLAEGAAGTDEKNLHDSSLREGMDAVCAVAGWFGKRRMIRIFLTMGLQWIPCAACRPSSPWPSTVVFPPPPATCRSRR